MLLEWTDLEFFKGTPFKESRYYKMMLFLAEERRQGKSILPGTGEVIFNALYHTPFAETKVVILGQDPYPTKGHAHGLAFSVPDDVRPFPKSLINIYKELKDDLGIFRGTGNLTDWADQGVLLLNTSLTVVEGNPGSHSEIGWGVLVNDVIRAISEYRQNVVFILWGKHAQQKEYLIDTSKHCVLKSPHPSPLSASRGFFGSKPFSKTNAYLESKEIDPIKW